MLATDSRERSDSDAVGYRIISAIAVAEGVDPLDLTPPEYEPLHSVVNVDALASLFRGIDSDDNARLTFVYSGYRVTVYPSGRVTIDDNSAASF